MTSQEKHISIAPAPRYGSSLLSPPGHDTNTGMSMPYNCQPCVRRKVKCDRATPICASCLKSRQECFYQAPPKPRRKKRRQDDTGDAHDDTTTTTTTYQDDEDLRDRLARYEHILRENGLLPPTNTATTTADADVAAHSRSGTAPTSRSKPTPPTAPATQQDSPAGPSSSSPADDTLKMGKLVSAGGKTRYIDSRIWLETPESIHDMSDQADPEEPDDDDAARAAREAQTAQLHATGLAHSYDPVSGALLDARVSLLALHPTPQHAMKLWAVYTEYVEPLVRIVHIATTAKMVETVSQQPHTASKAQECLLFAMYNFAVVALHDDECLGEFGESRQDLINKFSYALKQALVNTQWLATTEIMVFQGLLLYLISVRGQALTYDPHTFWVMTGIAVRIAQRMGLHRDGETLGLPPFETQMRRRLFWQLLPLEGFAGQHSGTGIALSANSWDTRKPLNINDRDLAPGMTHMPDEARGATDMLYVIARCELTELFVRKTSMREVYVAMGPASLNERVLAMIDAVEDAVEQKVFRYCDLTLPLHFQTLLLVRAAINAARLRHQVQPIRDNTIDDAGRAKLVHLAEKIFDADAAMYADPRVKNYLWQIKSFFFWDSVICMLTSLTKPGFFQSFSEGNGTPGNGTPGSGSGSGSGSACTWLDATWARLTQFATNHPEVFLTKSPLQTSAAKATLEAWEANPPSNCVPEPEFIAQLRAQRDDRVRRKAARGEEGGAAAAAAATTTAAESEKSMKGGGGGGGGGGKILLDSNSSGGGSRSTSKARRGDAQMPAAAAGGGGGGGGGGGTYGMQEGAAAGGSGGVVGGGVPFANWDGLNNGANAFDAPMSPGIGDWGFWDQFFQQAEPDHG